MADILRKVLDWKAVQTWCNNTFSSLTHKHDQYATTEALAAISESGFHADWRYANRVYSTWGNNAFQPIIHILVPGTIMVWIDGCGGDGPIVTLYAAEDPNYLLGSTNRVVNAGAFFTSAKTYTADTSKPTLLAAASNKVGDTLISAHIVPGENTYVRPIPVGQCTTHILRVLFIPDASSVKYDKYWNIVGYGHTYTDALLSTMVLNTNPARNGVVFGGDWKSNFNETTALMDYRSKDISKPIRWHNGTDWVNTVPVYIPPTRVTTSSKLGYYFFSGRIFEVRGTSGNITWSTNDSDGYPRSFGNMGSTTFQLSETATTSVLYDQDPSLSGDIKFDQKLSMRHYTMTLVE